ncbi:hypothetical protein [Bradyrhizobium sp. USDA 3650]
MPKTKAVATGADTSYVVNDKVIAAAEAQLGSKPSFWGRYFKGPQDTGSVQYKATIENPILRAHGIPVLCIARQTNHVGGSEADGRTDGARNAAAIVEAFGLQYLTHRGSKTLIFLDVEPEHPLSADYYFGWSEAVRGYASPEIFAPAVYGNKSSAATWKGLSHAVTRGAECAGLWVAHYLKNTGCVATPQWSDRDAVPAGIPTGCEVLAWQFAQECVGIDCNVANPAQVTALQAGLVLPPEATTYLAERVSFGLDYGGNRAAEPFTQALTTALQALTPKEGGKTLPDGRPYIFPDGIKSFELEVKVGTETGVTLKINGT